MPSKTTGDQAMMRSAREIIQCHKSKVAAQLRSLFTFVEAFAERQGIDPLTDKPSDGTDAPAKRRKNKTKPMMPNLGSSFKSMTRKERELINKVVNSSGGLKGQEVLPSLLNIIWETTTDDWVFRALILEVIVRSDEKTKQKLMSTDHLTDILRGWLVDLRSNDVAKSSHESLIQKILESMLALPMDRVSLKLLSQVGNFLQKSFSSARMSKKVAISNRVQMCCDKVLSRLKGAIAVVKKRAKDKKVISKQRRSSERVSVSSEKNPVASTPVTESKSGSTTGKGTDRAQKRSRNVTVSSTDVRISAAVDDVDRKDEDEPEIKRQRVNDDAVDVAADDDKMDVDKINASFKLPDLVVSDSAIWAMKSKKSKKKKKSVRFDLSRNTVHAVPFKEKSTMKKDRGSNSDRQLSRAEKQLLNRGDGKKAIMLIHGMSLEIEWYSPRSLLDVKDAKIESEEALRLTKRREGKPPQFQFGINASAVPDNPDAQDPNDKIRRKRFKTKDIPLVDLNAQTGGSGAPASAATAVYPGNMMGVNGSAQMHGMVGNGRVAFM
eukprot:g472.t1